jgi:hypothetical protein
MNTNKHGLKNQIISENSCLFVVLWAVDNYEKMRKRKVPISEDDSFPYGTSSPPKLR